MDRDVVENIYMLLVVLQRRVKQRKWAPNWGTCPPLPPESLEGRVFSVDYFIALGKMSSPKEGGSPDIGQETSTLSHNNLIFYLYVYF